MPDDSKPRQTNCPNCGASAERGQLVCLECGARIALDYRRPYGWKLPLPSSAGVVLLVGAGSAVALQAVDDKSSDDAAQAVGTVPKTTTEKKASAKEDEPAKKKADTQPKKAPAEK